MLRSQEFLCNVKAALKTRSLPLRRLLSDINYYFSPGHYGLLKFFDPSNLSDPTKVQTRVLHLTGGLLLIREVEEGHITSHMIRLNDSFNLSELECLLHLVAAYLQYDPADREQAEFYLHLWCLERKTLITALKIILEAIVLEKDNVASIEKCMQNHLNSGLQRQLINLIKDCYEKATAISDGCDVLSYIEEFQDVYEEWVMLAHCLFLSYLVVQLSPGNLTDVFYILKDSTAALARIGDGSGSQYQVLCGLLFSIITPLLPASADVASVFPDVSSRNIFHETVMTSGDDAFQEGIISCVRLAWAIHLMLIEENSGRELSWFHNKTAEIEKLDSCLETVFSNNAFQVFIDVYFKNVASKVDAEDVIRLYNASLHNLITTFLSSQLFQLKVEEVIDMARMNTRCFFDELIDLDSTDTKIAYERANKLTVSLLQFVCEIYKREPQLLSAAGASDVWTLGVYVWNRIGNYRIYHASLKLLCTLAYNEKGASSVFEWFGGEICNDLSWRNFFGFLKDYSKTGDSSLTEFPEDTGLIIAFLHLLMVVVRNGNVVEREQWFPDVEPLFMFLTSGKLPYELEDKVKDAINTFIEYCPKKEAIIRSYCKKYNVQVGDEGSQRGKRPRPSSSMEHVSDDMGQPKPKVPRQSTTELTTDSTSKDMGHSGGSTLLSDCDSLLMSYLDKAATYIDTDPAAASPQITIIQRTIVISD